MRVKLIIDNPYHTQRPHMRNTQSDVFCYPCVNNVGTFNTPTNIWWSNDDSKGHFGIPKIIFGKYSNGVFTDYDGSYAITQNCTAIVDKVSNLDNIVQALQDDDLMEVLKAMDVDGVNSIFNRKAIALFKHDFYNQFL